MVSMKKLTLIPLGDQTRGEDIYSALLEFITKSETVISKLVSIAAVKNKGFVSRFKKCIVHCYE